jgi:hypothetical protein
MPHQDHDNANMYSTPEELVDEHARLVTKGESEGGLNQDDLSRLQMVDHRLAVDRDVLISEQHFDGLSDTEGQQLNMIDLELHRADPKNVEMEMDM